MVAPLGASAIRGLHPKTSLNSILKPKTPEIDISGLQQKYSVEGLSARQIAKQFGMSKGAVLSALRKAGIKARSANSPLGRSNPPYGTHRVNGVIVNDPHEQKVIGTINKLSRDGLSYSAIARRLTEMAVPTRLGHTKWHHEMIRIILKREQKQEAKNGKAN